MAHVFIAAFGSRCMGINLDMGGIHHQSFHAFLTRKDELPYSFWLFCYQIG